MEQNGGTDQWNEENFLYALGKVMQYAEYFQFQLRCATAELINK